MGDPEQIFIFCADLTMKMATIGSSCLYICKPQNNMYLNMFSRYFLNLYLWPIRLSELHIINTKE